MITEELKKKLIESTIDVDKYLAPLNPKALRLRVADIETLASIAEEEALRGWFIESYKLLKKLQEAVK